MLDLLTPFFLGGALVSGFLLILIASPLFRKEILFEQVLAGERRQESVQQELEIAKYNSISNLCLFLACIVGLIACQIFT